MENNYFYNVKSRELVVLKKDGTYVKYCDIPQEKVDYYVSETPEIGGDTFSFSDSNYINLYWIQRYNKEYKHPLVIQNHQLYFKEIPNIPIPHCLIKKIQRNWESGYCVEKYFKFFQKLSLNPNTETIKNCFWFLQKYNIKISESGNLITYRNVVYKDGDKNKYNDLFLYTTLFQNMPHISKHYIYLWGEGNCPYEDVIEIGGLTYVYRDKPKIEYTDDPEIDYYTGPLYMGDIYDLIKGIDKSVLDTPLSFTDKYSHSTDIQIGKIVRIPREECDEDNNIACSRRLHSASLEWLQNNRFGDYGLKILVHPADLVAIPVVDSYGKLGSCAYLPMAVLKEENGKLIDDNQDVKIWDEELDKQFTKFTKEYSKNVNNIQSTACEVSTKKPNSFKELLEKLLKKDA